MTNPPGPIKCFTLVMRQAVAERQSLHAKVGLTVMAIVLLFGGFVWWDDARTGPVRGVEAGELGGP